MKKKSKKKKKTIELLSRGVCVKGGKVLLCRNRKHGNVYLPGGHVDWGEDSRAALVREWEEELGVPCKAGRFLGVVEQQFKARDGRTCEISMIFEVRCAAVSPQKDPPSAEPHLAFEWAELKTLKSSGLLPVVLVKQLPVWMKTPSAAATRWHGYSG